MIGLDTNVLIRYLVQDDPDQSRLASEFIEANCSDESTGFICHVVLCELSWVLESNYGQSRNQIALVIEQLLQISQLQITEPEAVWRALSDFKKSNADFADHLIARGNVVNGCKATVTFDKKAGKQDGFLLLE